MIKKIILILMVLAIVTSAVDQTKVHKDKFKSIDGTAGILDIPPRPAGAMSGSEFMQSLINLSFAARENAILNELLAGNVPEFMRQLIPLEAVFNDINGDSHQVKYWVMPDYLAIGSDTNFCRVPMGPIIAQTAADSFGACMPTRKLVDHIYVNAEIKLAPVTYTPVGNNNEKVEKFIEHNTAIQNQFSTAGGLLGQLVGGTKKDVVLSNRIVDPNRPDHVTIYGWHRLNGQPIQPLTNIHTNTYVDYSHGIRFLDSDIIIDGDTTTIQSILQNEILYKILSDEVGVMTQPTYILNPNLPTKPSSFGVKCENDGELKLVVAAEADITKHHLYFSRDGVNFDAPFEFAGNEYIYQNLSADSIYYFKLKAENSYGISSLSEVLAGMPVSSNQNKVLVVNGFDRASSGNSFDFVRQHGSAISNYGYNFESASNEAITAGLFSLNDYRIADYILGDESTVDESFSSEEQLLVAAYLKNGGSLFVSGSEIAWDLDQRGTAGDRSFIMNYLKARYSADAPGGVSNTHYSAAGIAGEIFSSLPIINFDNGTHGTINVNYADALAPNGGSKSVLKYRNVSIHDIAGLSYEGTFGSGTETGRLIYLGFPFETIYPESVRNSVMTAVLNFFEGITSAEDLESELPNEFRLSQNYPNPFNPITKIKFGIPTVETGHAPSLQTKIVIYDILGNKIATLVNQQKPPGTYEVEFDGSKLSSGVYIYRLTAGEYSSSKKMQLIK